MEPKPNTLRSKTVRQELWERIIWPVLRALWFVLMCFLIGLVFTSVLLGEEYRRIATMVLLVVRPDTLGG